MSEPLLRIADSCLVLTQRLTAWCGHAPALEEDIALANVALDVLGHARALPAVRFEEDGKVVLDLPGERLFGSLLEAAG